MIRIAAFILTLLLCATAAQAQSQPAPSARPASEAVKQWRAAVLAKLDAKRVFPTSMIGRGGLYTVKVFMTIAKDGKLKAYGVRETSGEPLFDQASLYTVASAAPFPPLPPEMGSEATFTIPIVFRPGNGPRVTAH